LFLSFVFLSKATARRFSWLVAPHTLGDTLLRNTLNARGSAQRKSPAISHQFLATSTACPSAVHEPHSPQKPVPQAQLNRKDETVNIPFVPVEEAFELR
jgi:hypothetical protein